MNTTVKLSLLALLAVPQLTALAMADVTTTETVAKPEAKATVSTENVETAPATLFFFSQVDKAASKKVEPVVLEFGDSVNVNSGGSTGLPASSTAFSPY